MSDDDCALSERRSFGGARADHSYECLVAIPSTIRAGHSRASCREAYAWIRTGKEKSERGIFF